MHADVWRSGSIVQRSVNFGTNCSRYSPSLFGFVTPWQRRHDAFRIGDLVGLKFGYDVSEDKGHCSPADDRTLIASLLARGLVIFVPECTGFRPKLKFSDA
jgi:hypothetical protein